MIKFIYEVDTNDKYVFRYNHESSRVDLSYPNGTTSVKDKVSNHQMFGDWVENILGGVLPPNTLSLLRYVFDKEINKGNEDFNIQASYLISNCMTDAERDLFRADAIRLDNEYFSKTGFRFPLDEVQLIYTSRHRIDAHIQLHQFNEALRLS